MDIKGAKGSLSNGGRHEDGDGQGGGGGDVEIKFLHVKISIDKIEEAFRLVHEKTGARDLEHAMDLVYHKVLTREEHGDVGRLVTILRCDMQGDIYPPGYGIHRHFRDFINNNYPHAGTTFGR